MDYEVIGAALAVVGALLWIRRDLRADLRHEIGEVRTDLRHDIGEVRADLRRDIGEVRADIRALNGRIDAIGGRIDAILVARSGERSG